MRGGVILCLSLLVVFVSASPLAMSKGESKDEKPMSVVDVPAGVFENAESDKPTETKTEGEVNKEVEKVETNKNEKEDEEGKPNIFGVRFPSILIIRRPAFFQDPFAGFQSPFFGGFNRRPIFAPAPLDSVEEQEKVKEREPLEGQDSKVDEQKQNETVLVTNVIQRMHQQINNLFANLFNPDAFNMPRPAVFSRPFFSKPSFFNPIPDDSEESLDFDKLPANYSNTTSETKIVDGQVVTVNKTVHKISGNNSNGFFHFSVIKVRPSALPEGEATPEQKNPEVASTVGVENVVEEKKPAPEADPAMNEVDRPDHEKLSQVELDNRYEVSGGDFPTDGQGLIVDEDVKIVPIKPAKLIQASDDEGRRAADLSSDIRVNNLMESSQQARVRALFDPDEVEVFDV